MAPRVQAAPQSGSAVAVRIREIRSQRCLSQRQLAAKMEVPRTYISKVENGRALPTLASLERLAVALSVQLGDLVQDNYSQRQQEITSLMSDPFVSEISLWVPKLDALQRSAVLNHLREMASGQRKTA
jgi:transcriptional regulator with XRE-family HTH domain